MENSLLFFGSDYFSSIVFEKLLAKQEVSICGVVTTSAQPITNISYNNVVRLSKEHSIKLYYANNKKDLLELEDDLQILKPTFALSASYGVLIPESIYSIPKYAMMNIHPSLLPKYRGPSPLQDQILDHAKTSGVSIITMANDVDAGNLILQSEYRIQNNDTTLSLGTKLFELGSKMVCDIIKNPNLIADATEQNHELATFTHKYDKDDARIDWEKDKPSSIDAKVRAFTPKPIAWTHLNDLVAAYNADKDVPQKWSRIRVQVLSGKIVGNAYLPDSLRIEGKSIITWEQFCHGYLK